MSTTSTYRILFSIDLYHHYLLDDGSSSFEGLSDSAKVKQLADYNVKSILEITPTPLCIQLLKDHQLIFRQTNKGIIIGCKIEQGNNRPIPDIANDVKFSFELKLVHPHFYNFTHLPLSLDASKIYYFNNLEKDNAAILNLSASPSIFSIGDDLQSGLVLQNADQTSTYFTNANTTNTQLSDLKKDIPAQEYDNNQSYKKGEKVLINLGGNDQIQEAKVDINGVVPNNQPANPWKKVMDLPLNYLNTNDLIKIINPFYGYEFSSDSINATATLSAIQPEGLNSIFTKQLSFVKTHQFDWRNIPAGRYQLLVTNDDLPDEHPVKIISEETFYLNNNEQNNRLFGIIEIFANRDSSNRFALFNDAGQFQTTENHYIIRLKNRSTIWRYHFNKSQTVDIDDDLILENADDKTLISKAYLPLTKKSFIPIQINGLRLPIPNTERIQLESPDIFSELYIYK